MPQLNLPVIHFHFCNSPLHIGNERSDYGKGNTYLHSDSLTAAIYFAWARLGKSEWSPKDENTHPGFVVSSLFPYSKNMDTNDVIYFLPRPKIRLINEESVETKLRKKLKKIQYVDSVIFSKMLKGESIPANEGNVSGIFRSLYKITDPIIYSQVVPRASVSRSGMKDTSIFYMERHYFSEDSGLYAIIQYNDSAEEEKVKIAINFLSEEGIGTDRNIGNGKFKPTFGESLTLDFPSDAKSAVNLGLFCPSDQNELTSMLNGEEVGYDLIRRAGWLSEPYNTWRKKEIFMFTEGSVFKFYGEVVKDKLPVFGKIENVKPRNVTPEINHPVWRSGRSIFIPF